MVPENFQCTIEMLFDELAQNLRLYCHVRKPLRKQVQRIEIHTLVTPLVLVYHSGDWNLVTFVIFIGGRFLILHQIKPHVQ